MLASNPSPQQLVERCQTVMTHAWMVRTFVKHCEEVDEYPELMTIARSIFDTARALETRVDDPARYLHMLGKKIGKLRTATEQFRVDAEQASAHTNFQQAVLSAEGCLAELDELLKIGNTIVQNSSE